MTPTIAQREAVGAAVCFIAGASFLIGMGIGLVIGLIAGGLLF